MVSTNSQCFFGLPSIEQYRENEAEGSTATSGDSSSESQEMKISGAAQLWLVEGRLVEGFSCGFLEVSCSCRLIFGTLKFCSFWSLMWCFLTS